MTSNQRASPHQLAFFVIHLCAASHLPVGTVRAATKGSPPFFFLLPPPYSSSFPGDTLVLFFPPKSREKPKPMSQREQVQVFYLFLFPIPYSLSSSSSTTKPNPPTHHPQTHLSSTLPKSSPPSASTTPPPTGGLSWTPVAGEPGFARIVVYTPADTFLVALHPPIVR